MIIPCIKELVKFGTERFTPVELNQTTRSKTMIVGLEPGQTIPVHHPGTDLTLLIVEGQATLVAGDEELEQAGSGALLIAEGGQARGIRADEQTIAVVVASPPPNEADHREVMEHFRNGTWR